jgi:hypothetical protein
MGGIARRTPLNEGLIRTLRAVAAVLELRPHQGAVIGGIGVIARGVPRLTRDVDVTFAADKLVLEELVRDLGTVAIVPRIPDALAFCRESQVLLLRETTSQVDVDLSLAWLPFELEAIASAPTESVAGVRLPIVRAEDLVIYKAIAWRPQDQQDVERLLSLHAGALDLDRIRRYVAQLGEALEIDRLRELDAMITRVFTGT